MLREATRKANTACIRSAGRYSSERWRSPPSLRLLELFGGSALINRPATDSSGGGGRWTGLSVAAVALPRRAKAPGGRFAARASSSTATAANARNVAAGFSIHERWPEAIVVYPEGLPTPGRLTDPEEEAGWQPEVGAEADRDLHFFDTMFRWRSRDLKVDLARVLRPATRTAGSSPTSCSSSRIERFAAVAPSVLWAPASSARSSHSGDASGGEKDTLVPFANQSA